ncbi:DUF3152 domain-containing protein [Streptomyces sp. NPDC052236]|uniref:DUF3152 domain-containing protein n=1 Tax=Streptomyces sp. NPDC052236 TaxID=3365686 RepID=UPI0037CF0DDE
MGRHSRKGPAPKGSGSGDGAGTGPGTGAGAATGTDTAATGEWEIVGESSGGGRRRHAPGAGPEQHAPSGYGTSQARGGHPEQHEAGGGWGSTPQSPSQSSSSSSSSPSSPSSSSASSAQRFGDWPRTAPGGARKTGPRPEFVQAFEAFENFDAFGQTQAAGRASPSDSLDPYSPVVGADSESNGDSKRKDRATADEPDPSDPSDPSDPPGTPGKEPVKGGKGRTFTGIAAAAVITVLGVVVAGQVISDSRDKPSAQSGDPDRAAAKSPASRSNARLVPPKAGAPAVPVAPAAPVTYAKLMATQFTLDPKLTASGSFTAVPGFEKAPGKGRKVPYRVDVEKGLGLDGTLFARAVQETLNDDRSWAHGGTMSFERISSGKPEFVITLASPGTTAVWCAKSGLDTTVDNVSCDSASTDRVMINAFRWARGAETYGPKAMLAYRQMLINHEVGHRLGYGHVNCSTPGALAPVMQQQTKTLDVEGIKCRANPWVYPTG